MLYGNPQAITNPSSKDVWNSDYAGVWHLQNTNDATVNNIIGTPGGVVPVPIIGQIGNAYNFNGAGYIRMSINSSLDLNKELTLSAWIRATNVSGYPRIVAKSHTSNNLPYTMYGLMFDNSQHTRLELSQGNGQTALDGNTLIPLPAQWRYVVGTYNGIFKEPVC